MMRRMKVLLVTLMLAFLSVPALAQTRVVRGVVFNEQKNPMSGVALSSGSGSEFAVTDISGSFEFRVSVYANSVTATKEGFLPHTLEIDGSYLVFTLKVDKDWSKKQAEKAAVEKAARDKAVADSLASVIATQKARDKAVADSLASVIAAQKARDKAVADSLAAVFAEEKAIRAKAVADSIAMVKAMTKAVADSLVAERKAARKAAEDEYASRYNNHGLMVKIELAYGYQINKGDVVFASSGYRDYGDQIPLQAILGLSYRINHNFAIGAGAGVLYDVRNISIRGDQFANFYPDAKILQVDVPLFLRADIFFLKAKVQPMISLKGGIYTLTVTPLADAGIGCAIRVSRRCAINVLVSAAVTPWPYFNENAGIAGYSYSITPTAQLGFSF